MADEKANENNIETGSLSINSENIFPIIKKWLYSDTDIFIRELVSNAADAITKLRRLAQTGETNIEDDTAFEIQVVLDAANKTISVTDNGVGMTADEIRRYINQIAFSGATDFLEKYKAAGEEGEIIGHFGLGFYSSFMVADRVTIDSLSYEDGAKAAHWECEGGVEFSMSETDKSERGTTVTLYISEESKAFLDDYKLRGVLRKYCAFVPIDIFYANVALKKDDEAKREPINNKSPLWLKKSGDCTDEEYKDFYRTVFSDFNEPLFWIHLNMDYPFRLKGILYFPKLKHDLDAIEGQVKLYNSQIFIADNIKEVIPEFLLLLKGVIDCPDLPLNVSRSFLQNDGLVEKISGYITKKVADKLTGLYNTAKPAYIKYWEDIAPFVKYGCIREKGFYDKVKAAVLYKRAGGDSDDMFITLEEYIAENEPLIGRTVYYVSAPETQGQYVRLLKDQGVGAVELHTRLDAPFISFVEGTESGFEAAGDMEVDTSGGDKAVRFKRVDSGVEAVKADDESAAEGEGEGGFEEIIACVRAAVGNDDLKVEIKALKSEGVPAIITLSEESRRMREMGLQLGIPGFGADIGENEIVIMNKTNPLIIKLMDLLKDGSREDDARLIAAHVYDMAALSHKQLGTKAMETFLERSAKILERIAK